jgi:Dihydrodipicolinate synthetase family
VTRPDQKRKNCKQSIAPSLDKGTLARIALYRIYSTFMIPIVGSIVALVTPMHEDGSVDYPGLRKLIDWHIQEGTDCIGVVGTTGESPTVKVEEHCEIIRVAVSLHISQKW